MLSFFKPVIRPLFGSNLRRNIAESRSGGEVTLHFWEPFPEKILGINNKPAFGRLSGGNTGHISLSVAYSDGKSAYVSIWPDEFIENISGRDKPIIREPIISSVSLEKDIEAENNRQPRSRTMPVSDVMEQRLKQAIEKLREELSRRPEDRREWTVRKNCAYFIDSLLQDCGLIHRQQSFIPTPRYVFEAFDPVEQAIALELDKTPNYKY